MESTRNLEAYRTYKNLFERIRKRSKKLHYQNEGLKSFTNKTNSKNGKTILKLLGKLWKKQSEVFY